MSELGSNEGQGQEQKTPFFDSSKISDKKDVEHFSNVEGAAERAKAAERARKAAEKEAQEVHAADIRAASEQLKKEEKGEKKSKKKIIVFVIILAILAALGVLGAWLIGKSAENARNEKDSAAIELAQSIYVEAEDIRLGGSYDDAKQKFEDALQSCTREERIFITLKYAEYIASMEYDSNKAFSMIDDVKNEAQSDLEKEYVESSEYLVKLYSGEYGDD